MKQTMHLFLRTISFKLCVIICLFLAPDIASASPAYPHPIRVRQPDGTSLTIRIHGDEYFHYKTTTDGYVIGQDPDKFYYHVSYQSNGARKLLTVRAGRPKPTLSCSAYRIDGCI